MRTCWREWLSGNTEEIAPWVGLSLGALYLAAVAGVGLMATHVHRSELSRQYLQDAQAWVSLLAQDISRARTEGPDVLARELRRAGRREGISFCGVVSTDGVFTAHGDATKVGQRAARVAFREGELSSVSVGPQSAAGTVVAIRLAPVTGEQSPPTLQVGIAPMARPSTQSKLLVCSGYVLLGVLGIFLLLYRRLRRAVQPLAAIRGRLLGLDPSAATAQGDGPAAHDGLGERLLALRLNNSFDQISTSWNRLIEFITEMQQQIRRARVSADVAAAMDGYRAERLSAILMQIPFGVLVVDAVGKIAFANRAASGMLAAPGESLDGTAVAALLDEKLRLAVMAPAGPRGAPLTTSRWIDHIVSRPHGDVALRFWSSTVEGDGGEHILFVQDVTQIKEAERARDAFLYHVTHELRTPLTNIRAFAETLAEGVIDDSQTIRECYNVITAETQRLNRLVEDILNVSQLEVGSARLDIGEVQLDRLMRGVVQDMQASADARNIDLVLNLPAKMPHLRGDKERLAVVLTNLVGNAIKYTPAGGRIDVRCIPEHARVRITVTDTGIGIRAKDQEKIFDKFYRADDERVAAIPGTGLGLAIVKETVRLHGGAVFVESTPGQGSTFTITLPAMVDESAGETSAPAGAKSA